MPVNKQIILRSRPSGEACVDNFKLVTSETPELQEGQVLVRNHYLSVDPYMRLRMNEGPSYTAPVNLGDVMIGGTVGEVVESRNAEFAVGDKVAGFGGWQHYAVFTPDSRVLRKIDAWRVPESYFLGACGMPGFTAWIGLLQLCALKPGETVLVSAASGAVGSVVGQLAKAHGCRVVGLAGGPAKCAYVVDELGFNSCIDYKEHATTESLVLAIREAAPAGIDVDFENVGGMILDAALENMNDFGRIAVCGFISGYEGVPQPMARPALILTKRLTLRGFIVGEHREHYPAALAELVEMAASGKLKYRESVAEGLEAAPDAFLGMLKGKNLGKQLVKLI